MKKYWGNILLLLFIFVSCSEKGNEKKAEPLSGPHSEIYIQYNSQEIQYYEMETNDSLNNYLINLLQSDSILSEAIIKTGEEDSKNGIQKIRDKLAFEGVEKTQLLVIRFYDSDEKFANAFLKNLTDALSKNLLKSIINESNSKMRRINEALDSLSLIMHEQEIEIGEYFEEEEIDAVYHEDYFTQYNETFQKKKWLVSMKICLEGQDELCLSTFVTMMDESDPYLKKALDDMNKLQEEKNQIQCATVSNKQCQEIDRRKNIMKKDVLVYLENSIKALDHQSSEILSKINAIPKKNPNYGKNPSGKILNLDREKEEKLYYHLIEQKTTLSIEKAGIVPPIKILDGPKYKRK